MSAKKKDNEDSVVIFKQEPGQSKDDAWLFYDAKVIGVANNLHPDFAPFIFEQQQQLTFLNSDGTDEEDAFQAKAPERAE